MSDKDLIKTCKIQLSTFLCLANCLGWCHLFGSYNYDIIIIIIHKEKELYLSFWGSDSQIVTPRCVALCQGICEKFRFIHFNNDTVCKTVCYFIYKMLRNSTNNILIKTKSEIAQDLSIIFKSQVRPVIVVY